MSTVKGILSFNDLFVPKAATKSGDPKFQAVLLFPPGDPQIPVIQAELDAAKAASFPSGMPNGARECFNLYDTRYAGKDYYDPRISGYMVLSTTAKPSDPPHVVDLTMSKIINAGHSGLVAGSWVNLNYNMSGYTEGQQGVGGWLNGIQALDQMGPLGSLSNKPTAEQMFGAPAAGAQQGAGAPPPPETVGASPPPPGSGPIMTDTATCTYEVYKAGGWTDEQLIAKGFMLKPSFA